VNVYFSTTATPDNRQGRASHLFVDKQNALDISISQNNKAERMGIKARYSVATADSANFSERPRDEHEPA